jgi:hypothetical protein
MKEKQGDQMVCVMIDNADLRSKLANRTDVLDKVKRIFFIPGLEMTTAQQVAEYYGVDVAAIKRVYDRNTDEIAGDGVRNLTASQILAEAQLVNAFTSGRYNTKAVMEDGEEVSLSNAGNLLFSQRAVMRIGILLGKTEVVDEFRTQLLNIFQDASIDQQIEELSIEQEILQEALNGYEANSITAVLEALVRWAKYKKRREKEAENTLTSEGEKDDV